MKSDKKINPWHVFQMAVGVLAIIVIGYFAVSSPTTRASSVTQAVDGDIVLSDSDFETYMAYEFEYFLEKEGVSYVTAEAEARTQYLNDDYGIGDDTTGDTVSEEAESTSSDSAPTGFWDKVLGWFQRTFLGTGAEAATDTTWEAHNKKIADLEAQLKEAEWALNKEKQLYAAAYDAWKQDVLYESPEAEKRDKAIKKARVDAALKALKNAEARVAQIKSQLAKAKQDFKDYQDTMSRQRRSTGKRGSSGSRDRQKGYADARDELGRTPTYEEWVEAFLKQLEANPPTTPKSPIPEPEPLPAYPTTPGLNLDSKLNATTPSATLNQSTTSSK
ncbi:MAG: hypothetical protein PHR51_00915 [Patescibacteria group bacterium]|nr:hypothetical protein [Patescibacteria group bacterium]